MIWAWIGAAAVGLSLGLLGSGGAILTVPILVYLVGHSEKSAIAESLAIVGTIACLGALRAARAHAIDVRSALLLALPGIIGTTAGTRLSLWIKGEMQLVLLALLMCVAAVLMFRDGGAQVLRASDERAAKDQVEGPAWVVLLQGLALGVITGLVGVGGGFLIVPVLVLLRRLPMHRAVGTSLAVITINSVSGFLQVITLEGIAAGSASKGRADAGPATEMITLDWHTIGAFSVIGCIASIGGYALGGRIPAVPLRRAFAVVLLLVAGIILLRSTLG